MIRRFLLPVLALATAGVLTVGAPLAAQGGGSTDVDRLVNSGQATVAAGSARIVGKVSVTGVSTTSGNVSFSGQFDFKRHSGRLKIDASALGAAGNAKITFLLVSGVAYISIDSLRGHTGSTLPKALNGKKWLRLDLNALGAAGGQAIGQTDPSSTLFTLRGVTQNVQNLGSDKVTGVPTTHYRVQIDLMKALQQVPASQRATAEQTIKSLGSGLLPADVWLDSKGRLRRFSLTFHTTSSGENASFAETFEFTEFGGKVSVSAPPSSETIDFTQLFSGLSPGQGSSTS